MTEKTDIRDSDEKVVEIEMERLGYKKIPVIIRMMQDDEAVVTMVDSNLQREQITASEKAYAYKMKYDAIKKKAGRKNRYVLYCAKRYVQI